MGSSQGELFGQNLVEIEAQIIRLKLSIEKSRLTINEHCKEQIRLIDIETETKLETSDAAKTEDLDEQRKEWLQEMSKYEAECVRHMEETKGQLLAYIGLTEQWLEAHRDSQDRSELIIQQSNDHLTKLTMLGFELKGFQFGGKLLLFSEEYRDRMQQYPSRLNLKELSVPQMLVNYYKGKFPSVAESSKVIFMYLSP
jgi:hypothetical protein